MVMNEEAIFDEALEKKTPEERAAFLEKACADDAELRKSVESLLNAYDEGEFLESSLPSSPHRTPLPCSATF